MKIVVLISCMNETDTSILEKSNIQTDVVIVNQCDKNEAIDYDYKNRNGVNCHVRYICTTERGLSNSRNMAVLNAWGDICYLCDDDELLVDNFVEIISNAYKSHPSCDIITFALNRKNYTYPQKEKKVGVKEILRTSSVQISFKRNSIINKHLLFDPQMGSGSGNGGGEENKFLMDCKRKGLSILYSPRVIATVQSEESNWFSGFTKQYFKDTAWSARRILGFPLGLMYLFYWATIRSNDFDISFSKITIIKCFCKGFFEKRE